MGKLLVLLLWLLLVPVSVVAVGVSPAKIALPFQPHLQQNLTISILNSGQKDANVSVTFSGDLAEYVEADATHFIVPHNSLRPYTFALRLPATIEKPGTHTIKILAVEAPLGKAQGISTLTGIAGELRIFVPYAGKYAELQISAHDVNEGEPVTFSVLMSNLAKEDITSAVTTLSIFDELGALVGSITTPPTPIPASSSNEVSAVFATEGIKPGTFPVEGVLRYDGLFSEIKKLAFKVGTLSVALVNYTQEFPVNAINKFSLEVENKWNSEIKNLFGEIHISQDGVPVNNVLRTPSIPLQPWERQTLTAFWDTTGLAPGTYTAEITLHYHDKTTKETVQVELVKPFELTLTVILVSIIVLILLVDFVLWLHRKRREDAEE